MDSSEDQPWPGMWVASVFRSGYHPGRLVANSQTQMLSFILVDGQKVFDLPYSSLLSIGGKQWAKVMVKSTQGTWRLALGTDALGISAPGVAHRRGAGAQQTLTELAGLLPTSVTIDTRSNLI
jgi:hypothetical protein